MIVILSYCDTKDKKERLSSLIDSLKKKYTDQKILVYSHYQKIEPEYYTQSDYYIFDHTNPVSKKGFADWIWPIHQGKKFYRWGEEDWGFAVLQMIKRSSLFIKSISPEGCLFLNYDCDPSGLENFTVLEKSKDLEDSQIGVFCLWGGGPSLSLTCFYLDLPKIDSKFFESITFERYMSFSGYLLPEDVFKSLMEEEFSGRYVTSSQGLPSQVSGASRGLPTESSLTKFFGTLLPSRNNFPDDKRKCLAAWNCTERVDRMGILIEDTQYFIYNEVEGENGNLSFFSHLPDLPQIEAIKITSINDEEIDPPYLIGNLDPGYWNRNYHEQV
jgi:hypothetical protein